MNTPRHTRLGDMRSEDKTLSARLWPYLIELWMTGILANLALLLSAGGYGSLVRKLIPPSFRQVDRFAVILLTGTGLIGTLLFCVGQLWFSRWAILLILLGGIILGLKYLSLEIRQLRG